jgi:PEGA domain-containing protein/FecR-like protein
MICPREERLIALVEQPEIDAQERALLESHLSGCFECATKVRRAKAARADIELLAHAPGPELAWRGVEAQIFWKMAPHAAAHRWRLWLAASASAAALLAVGFLAARWTTNRPSANSLVATQSHSASVRTPIQPVAPVKSTQSASVGIPLIVQGRVDFVREGRTEPLTLGAQLRAGDRVLASDNSRALIQTAADTVFAVEENSVVDLRSLNQVWHEVALARGIVANRVGKRKVGSRYAVVAGDREIRVRGTLFSVARADGFLEVTLEEGIVEVADIGSAAPPMRLVAPARIRLPDGASPTGEPAAQTTLDLRALVLAPPDHAVLGQLRIPGPAGAAIAMDGQTIGQAPLALRLAKGPHVVRLEQLGYEPHEVTVTIGAEEVEISPTLVSKAAPRERLQQVAEMIRSQTPELRACYERSLKRTARPARADLSLSVDRQGQILKLRAQTNVDDPTVAPCLERSARRWTFGPGPAVDVIVPLTFVPKS